MKTQLNETKRMQQLAGLVKENEETNNESKKLTTFEQVEIVLNTLIEDYLEGVAENTGEDGTINWGSGVLGYDSEEQLLQDLITYIQNK